MPESLLGLTPDVARAYSCPKQPSPERTETYQDFLGGVHELEGQPLPYRLFVPQDYDPTVAYPLVLYLHHAGLVDRVGVRRARLRRADEGY